MNVRFLEAADEDVADAFAFYNSVRPGLGIEFVREVRHTIVRRATPSSLVSVVAAMSKLPNKKVSLSCHLP
jgi:hypothetical protein